MVIEIATAVACLLAACGELLHRRRVQRVALLAFGAMARPMAWVVVVPWLRVVAFGLLTWGFGTLLAIEPKVHKADSIVEGEHRHLLLVLDVSPSMRLVDAGPTRKQSRSHRIRDVLDSLFGRVTMGHYRVTVVATYSGAKPVVIDTEDSEVVRNILTDLPMQYAFEPGKTKLFDGLQEAARIAKSWEARSTILIVLSDGDTIPATGMPNLPPSIGSVLVVGVGDPLAGMFIDGRQSRQDVSMLRQMAVRLRGTYHNGNRKHLPTELIQQLTESAGKSEVEQLTRREYALMAIGVAAALLALLPLLLHFAGTFWQPGTRAVEIRGAESGKNRSVSTAKLARKGAVAR